MEKGKLKRILLIAEYNSPWTYNFIRMLVNCCQIDFISADSAEIQFIEKYEKLNIRSFSAGKRHNIVFRALHFWSITKRLCKKNHYDIVNIQYVSPKIVKLIGGVIRKEKVVFSYWGSDLFRESQKTLLSIKRNISRGYLATFDNMDLKVKFEEVYGSYTGISEEVVMLPLPVFKKIDYFRDIIERERLITIKGKSVDTSKWVISVGYNASRAQQHIKVLKQIGKLPKKVKSNLFLILQLTYGGDKEYIKSVIDECERLQVKYVVYEEYLDEDSISKIRLVTDIYINAQTTDAFSGSLCEYIYADTLIVNARWLRYAEFDEYGFDYVEFEEFSQLVQILNGLVIGEVKEKWNSYRYEENRNCISLLRGEGACKERWKKELEL